MHSISVKSKILETAKVIKTTLAKKTATFAKTAANVEKSQQVLGTVSEVVNNIQNVAPAAIAITAVAATAVAAPPIAVLIASIIIIAKNIKNTYDLNEDLKNLIGEAEKIAESAKKITQTDKFDQKFRNVYTHIMNLFVTCNYLECRYKNRRRNLRFVFFPQDYLDEISQQLTLLNSAILVIIIDDPDILTRIRRSEEKSATESVADVADIEENASNANNTIQQILNPLFDNGNDDVAVFQNMGLTPESYKDIEFVKNDNKSSTQKGETLSQKFLNSLNVEVLDTGYSGLHGAYYKGGWIKRNRRTKYKKQRKMRKTQKPIRPIKKQNSRRATKSTKN
jgi:hypothetical protein